ncbi:uncharacterized protein [Ptychodera flava]|uniref:uncharacterized protein n=1 Tax=Ptychodera flava TaxID=63121 RepID=UPI00396A1B55
MADVEKDDLEETRRVLDELKKRKRILLESKDQLSEDDVMLKSELLQSKGEFHKLKIRYKQLQSKAKFWEVIESGTKENDWPSPSAIDKEIKATKSKFEGVKDDIAMTTEELEELTQTAQTAQEKLEERLQQFEEKLQQIQEKKARFQEVKAKYEHIYGNGKSKGLSPENIDAALENQRKQLDAANQAIAQCGVAMTTLKVQIESLKDEDEAIKQRVEDARLALQKLQQEKQGKDEEVADRIKWCEGVYNLLSHSGRITNPKVEGKCISLEITPLANHCTTLLVQIQYREDTHGQLVMDDVKVNIDTLVLDEIIKIAKETNDVGFVLNEIMHQYDCHAPILGEIEDLRQRYAIDWIDNENVVRLMLADDGHIVCTLTIDKGYPAIGGVTLKNVTGIGKDTQIGNLKPSVSNPSITDWMQYLHEELGDVH